MLLQKMNTTREPTTIQPVDIEVIIAEERATDITKIQNDVKILHEIFT